MHKAKIFVVACKFHVATTGSTMEGVATGNSTANMIVLGNVVKIPLPNTNLLVTKTNQNQIKVQINNYDFNGIHLISKATIKIR